MTERNSATGIAVKFNFQPYHIEQKEHIVEKSEQGMKRKYVRGIASGIRQDGHGERMTNNCIKSFSDQANSGDILLYPDVHGIQFTKDIGILTFHEIQPNGDWFIENRLYDEADNVGQGTLETVDKLWKQLNGLPPYTKPKQKGFSIEGFVPNESIVASNPDGTGRVMDNVLLDGVVIVPRPAYQDSIAHAVYKALGEPAPWVADKITNEVSQIFESFTPENYIIDRYELDDILYKSIDKILITPYTKESKTQLVNKAVDIYRNHLINMIGQYSDGLLMGNSVEKSQEVVRKDRLIKSLTDKVNLLNKSITKSNKRS